MMFEEAAEQSVGQGNLSTWMNLGNLTLIAMPATAEQCDRVLELVEQMEHTLDEFVSLIRQRQARYPERSALDSAILPGQRKEDE